MTTKTPTAVSRRQALRRGIAAGAVVWTAPLVMSDVAQARGGSKGSKGSKFTGKLKSVDCQWIFNSPVGNRGMQGRREVYLSGLSICEVNGGDGWKVLSKFGTFTCYGGKFSVRYLQGAFGQSGMPSVEDAVDGETDLVTTTTAPPADPEPAEPTPSTTVAPTPSTTEATTPATTVAPTSTEVPVTTEASPDSNAPSTTSAPMTTAAPSPAIESAPGGGDAIDTTVIDLSGRTEISIGDAYGYFQIVDAEPA